MNKIIGYIKSFFSKCYSKCGVIFDRICKDSKRFFVYLSIGVTSAVILCAAALIFIFHFSKDLPAHDTLKNYFPKIKTKILSSDGYQIAEYYRENRAFIPFEFIPKKVINAFLAAEDKNFYKHHGVDFYGLLRSIITNIKNFKGNKRLVGGSTITQQVAKTRRIP